MVGCKKSRFKMHEVQNVFIPHPFQPRGELFICIPKLQDYRQKLKQRKPVRYIARSIRRRSAQLLAGVPQFCAAPREIPRRFRKQAGSDRGTPFTLWIGSNRPASRQPGDAQHSTSKIVMLTL